MPIARVQMPDGKIGRFEVPEGTTPEQVTEFVGRFKHGTGEFSGNVEDTKTGKVYYENKHIATGKPSMGESVARGFVQGGTLNSGDEAMAAIGTAIARGQPISKAKQFLAEMAAPFSETARNIASGEMANQAHIKDIFKDQSIMDTYREGRGIARSQESAAQEANPWTYGLSQVAGGAATLPVGKMAQPFSNATGVRRIGNAMAIGAQGGALAGLGTSEADITKGDIGGAAMDTALGAGIGAGGGLVLQGASEAINAGAKGAKTALQGITARTNDQLDDAANAIKESSSKAYRAMRESGATINRPRAVNISNRVEAAIQKDGKLNASLHDKTLSVLDDFKKAAREGDFTLEELDQWRQLFGEVAGNYGDKINARKASIAIRAIDDAVDNLSTIDIRGGNKTAVDALKSGRSEWAKARKFERISDIVKKSEGDANYLKRELRKIVMNPKLSRGFSPQEIKAIDDASKMTAGDSILKTLGRFGFDSSRLGTGVGALVGSGAAGAAFGAPGAVAAPIVGTGARQLRKALTLGVAENILRNIENPSMKAVTKDPKMIADLIKALQGANPVGALARTR